MLTLTGTVKRNILTPNENKCLKFIDWYDINSSIHKAYIDYIKYVILVINRILIYYGCYYLRD